MQHTPLELCSKADALLFDLDGTLVDSMPAHTAAWNAALAPFGCSITEELLQEYAGIPNEPTVELWNARFGWKLPAAEVAHAKEAGVLDHIPEFQPIASVMEIVREFHGRIPFAVVSGGSRALVSRILEETGLAKWFQAVVAFEDTARGKPHPDPFLEAARRLGVSATDCVVFEDGEAGIQGARAAGMAVVRVAPGGKLAVI